MRRPMSLLVATTMLLLIAISSTMYLAGIDEEKTMMDAKRSMSDEEFHTTKLPSA